MKKPAVFIGLMLCNFLISSVQLAFSQTNFWTPTNTGLTDTLVLTLTTNSSGHIFAGTWSRGVFRSTNYGNNWTAINIGKSDTAVLIITVKPTNDHIFAGTYRQGIFRSTNNGDSWTQINSGLTVTEAVQGLVVNPSNGDIFAGTFSFPGRKQH